MKSRIPTFQSLEQERRFWETHSAADFLDELRPAKNVRFEFANKPRQKPVSIKLTRMELQVLQGVLARLTGTPVHSRR